MLLQLAARTILIRSHDESVAAVLKELRRERRSEEETLATLQVAKGHMEIISTAVCSVWIQLNLRSHV